MRLPVALRGYRFAETDLLLDRLTDELRDARRRDRPAARRASPTAPLIAAPADSPRQSSRAGGSTPSRRDRRDRAAGPWLVSPGSAAPGPSRRPTTSPITTTSGAPPLHGDRELFERMSLEAFQSGLSWLIILRKRPAFRLAFADFDIATVAAFDERDVDRLLADAGIVRNRAKIEATINNARRIARRGARGSRRVAVVVRAGEARPGRLGAGGDATSRRRWPRSSSGAASSSSARPRPTR